MKTSFKNSFVHCIDKLDMMKKLLLLLLVPMVSCQDVEVRKTYYDSGKLQDTVNYVDGLAQGEWKAYYESEKLKFTENYVDNIKQ